MRKIPFSEKNNFVVRNKKGDCFDKDLELFKKTFPSHRLNNSLARANQFTKESLDGQMLYLLLDKISPEDILKNRGLATLKMPASLKKSSGSKPKAKKKSASPKKKVIVPPESLPKTTLDPDKSQLPVGSGTPNVNGQDESVKKKDANTKNSPE